MAGKDTAKTAHGLLDIARDQGCDDAAWETVFARLRECPAALARPEPRKLALLQQAAYWGNKGAVEALLAEFKADPLELAADGTGRDAAAVAAAQGHHEVAAVLREAAAKAKTATAVVPGPPAAAGPPAVGPPAAAAAAAAAPAPKPPAADDVKLAHELLSQARDQGAEDAAWTAILSKLRERPGAVVRPEVRKFSLLHQAAYWGKQAAAETLLVEFGADPLEATADNDAHDAARVAESRGHHGLATWLRERAAKKAGGEGAGAAAADEKASGSGGAGAGSCSGDAAEEDALAAAAPSPYVMAKGEAGKVQAVEGTKGSVMVWLCLRGGALKRRWELFSPAEQAQIAGARAKGESSAKFGPRTLDLEAKMEVSEDGTKSRASCFHVLWEWDAGAGGKSPPEWQPYPADAQWQLESAMCAANATVEVKVTAARQYVIDLVGLRQYSAKDTFRCRRVRRRGVSLRDPFPAKVRDVATGSWLDLLALPDYWDGAAANLGEGEARRYDLPEDSPVFAHICSWINSTIRSGHAMAYGQVPGYGGPTKGMEVVRVEVVQQPALWRRYCCYKGKLKTQADAIKKHAGTTYMKKQPSAMPTCEWLDQDVGEAYFWHGSGKSSDGSVDLIDAIVSVGHEPSDENSSEAMEVSDGASSRFAKTTSMFGAGVYLADIASKANLYVPCSVCYQGAYFRDPCHCSMEETEKAAPYRMLLCRAVMGRVYVEKKYKDARYKGDFNPAKKLGADSVMGEAVKGQLAFREYVVYNDSASYPEFIVHYRRRSHAVKPPGPPPLKKAKKLGG